MIFRKIFFIPAAVCLLLACTPPRPLTFEEQEAYMAKQQCSQEATNMNPDWPGSDNPLWSDYFVMCMNSLGIDDTALRRLYF